MITNERQYHRTKAKVVQFEQAQSQAVHDYAHLSPRLRQAAIDGVAAQLAELRAELADYEALRSGRKSVVEVTSLGEIGTALIQARVAAHLSQEALGQRLGVSKQQVQQDEAGRYAGAGLQRLLDVAAALGMTFHIEITLPTAVNPHPDPIEI